MRDLTGGIPIAHLHETLKSLHPWNASLSTFQAATARKSDTTNTRSPKTFSTISYHTKHTIIRLSNAVP